MGNLQLPAPVVMLVDNGSRRATSYLQLRRLAQHLGNRLGITVHAVSLQHADRIPVEDLGGKAALTLEPFVRSEWQRGVRDFRLVPLFFGASRALQAFVPDTMHDLQQTLGTFTWTLAQPLCPLPAGEPRLAQLLCDNLQRGAALDGNTLQHVVLVDHGSPIPEVTAVRQYLARTMMDCLPAGVQISEAVMERRDGAEYDFNGPLLEQHLRVLAEEDPHQAIHLSMLFFAPGRHAGSKGDIPQICQRVGEDYPGLAIRISPLVGEHDGVVDILQNRLEAIWP